MPSQDNISIPLVALIFIVIVVAYMFIPYGDNITVNGDTFLTSTHYVVGNDEYHIRGLMVITKCGSNMDRVVGLNVKEFTVSKEVYHRTLSNPRIGMTYSCKGGQITDVIWGE